MTQSLHLDLGRFKCDNIIHFSWKSKNKSKAKLIWECLVYLYFLKWIHQPPMPRHTVYTLQLYFMSCIAVFIGKNVNTFKKSFWPILFSYNEILKYLNSVSLLLHTSCTIFGTLIMFLEHCFITYELWVKNIFFFWITSLLLCIHLIVFLIIKYCLHVRIFKF